MLLKEEKLYNVPFYFDKLSEVKTRIVPTSSKDIQNILNAKNILGIIEYNVGKESFRKNVKPYIPFLNVHMPSFDKESYIEIWSSDKDITYWQFENLQFAADRENLFVSGSFGEFNENLNVLGEKIYNELFKNIYGMHYPYIYRMWNYFPYINQNDKNDLERYKAFCYGRAMSFTNHYNFPEIKSFPAATGIGSLSGNVNIYFISSSIPQCIHVENPRQIPAYRYPPQYGPKPPSFGRATFYKKSNNRFNMYISGTASVIGHKTQFVGDIKNQCITSIDNIEILISKENLRRYNIEENLSLNDLDCIKVYIRNDEDYDIVRKICEERFSQDSILYVKADICRKDLLVEIEGIVQK